ncbi:MAG: DUF4340 domain-containing protein [Candidatus Krumholzibacteriota bacterium]|nr:DUF4340 domain-containing protein [Candidatus Krumholzibacteriota bacterium]
MKFKKEYVGLVVIIAALVLYLSLRDTDKINYTLPAVEPLEKSEISKIIINKKDTKITLAENDGSWLIKPQNYAADKQEVDRLLKEFSDFRLTEMVSEAELYSRYGFEEDNKIHLQAFTGENIKRDFYIGKAASTKRHTYVMLKDNTKIYEARNNIRNIFDKTIDELRDKNVLSFEATSVRGLTIKTGDKSIEFEKSAVPQPVTPGEQKESPPHEPEVTWRTTEGKTGKPEVIKQIFRTLSTLQCNSYIDGKIKSNFTDPVYTITVNGNETHTLSIFKKRDDGKYPAISSGSDYPFLLTEWKAKQIMKEPEEFIVD